MMTKPRALLLAATVLAACGDDDATATSDAAPPGADAGPSDFRADTVGFVHLIESAGGMGTWAQLQDGPARLLPVELAGQGDCAIFERPSTCDGCTDPQNRSAGPITVSGLTVPLTFQPSQFGYALDTQPPADLFADGASITVSAPGDEVPGWNALVGGVPPLEAPFQNLTLVDGQDAEITWTAAAGDARIQVMLAVGWHGAPPKAFMVCETADDGSLTIPGTLIAELPRDTTGLEQGFSWIMRFRRNTIVTADGPVELLAGSGVGLYFAHP